ncbi:MAG: 3-methylornithine--L-lysine ligase PylC [Desulfotignum sp.]|nr:3-methylornithine--L-lysine ligase PylC [Desulfotignum sp.]
MRIAVVGGRLQGVEVVYLARKAGYRTLVIDKSREVPAAGMADRFVCFEFTPGCCVPDECPDVDLIIPAIEDQDVLQLVEQWAQLRQIPLAFDGDAYALTCSKRRSNALFEKFGLPFPGDWPGCGVPVVVKPDRESGSRGVTVYRDAAAFHADFSDGRVPETLLAQQYLTGSQFSIEVVGVPGRHNTLCVTELHMDRDHDCKRVTAPTRLSSRLVLKLEEMAMTLAEAIGLKGIMDLEVILDQGDLKLLEIDARFPSQTPMAVYWATGINMVQLLAEAFVPGHGLPDDGLEQDRLYSVARKEAKPDPILETAAGQTPDPWVVVEHIQAGPHRIRFLGEHIMGGAGPLHLAPGFFGCREAVTNFRPDRPCWVGTLVFCADSPEGLAALRKSCYQRIRDTIRQFAKTGGNVPQSLQDRFAVNHSKQEKRGHDPASAR